MVPDELSPKPKNYKWKWLVFLAAGLLFLGWLLGTPPGFFGKLDALGYAVCHRIESRSFVIGERQFPLCVRCSGMFLGAIFGLVFQAIISPRRAGLPPRLIMVAFGLLVLAFIVDGANSFLHLFQEIPLLYEPHNDLRLFTGTGMGLVLSAALFPAFNQTVWINWDNRSAIPGWTSFTGMVILGVLLDLLILTGNPLVLYPLAVVSSIGVLILLVMIYSMIWIMLFRLDNRYTHYHQLSFPLAGGFILALLQIALFSLLRFLLTGTWDGFPLG